MCFYFRKRGPFAVFSLYFFQKSTLFVVLLLSAAADLSCRRIPNGLLLTGFVGITLCKLWSWLETDCSVYSALLLPAVAAGTAILLLLPFYRRKMIGGGDVKLIALILFACPSIEGMRKLFYMFLVGVIWFFVDSIREKADSGGKKKVRPAIPLGACAAAGFVLDLLLRK